MMHHPPNDQTGTRDPRSGAVLFFVLALIGFVSLLAFTSFTLCEVDLQTAQNQVRSTRAFMNADGGVSYVKSELEHSLSGGVSFHGLQNSINIQPPVGMTFDPVTQLTQLPDPNLYTFQVTGRDRTAQTTIEATIRQASALTMGVFGDEALYFFPNIDVYSYYSTTTPNPTPADSTGEATVGSNEALAIQPNVHIDGRFYIGANDLGFTGSYPTGYNVEEVGRINPDPLGAIGGDVAALITDSRSNNDNSNATFIDGNDKLRIWNSSEVLSAGDYHLSSAQLNGDLDIDTSSGRVNIYLEGGFETWPGSTINVTGNPDDFRIFSNSSDLIWLRPNNDFRGFVYAPIAEIRIWPNGAFYGVIWGEDVDLHPGGDIYVDLSILDKIKSNRILIVAWKEIRR